MKERGSMTCRRFTGWLDSGMPLEGAAAALAHAAVCTECAARESAARELEALLASAAQLVSCAFTTAVMGRVAVPRTQPVEFPVNPLPWWVRAVGDPACALALVASALLFWGLDRLPQLQRGIASATNAVIEMLSASAPRLLDAGIWSAVVVSLAPSLILASVALYGWSLRRVCASTLAGFWR